MRKELIARYLIPSAIVAGIVIACGEQDADADAPAATAPKVVVMNTSGEVWHGMTILVDGVPTCQVAELASGGTVTVHDGACDTLNPEPAAAPEPEPEPAADVAQKPVSRASSDPAPAPTVKTSAATGGALHATTTVSGGVGPARRIGIVNNDSFGWSRCTVTLNGVWSYSMPRLAAGEHEGIMGVRFKNATGDTMTQNHQITAVAVSCAEGSGTFRPQ
ncbi:MAG: hypothetical protein ABIO70_23665 [Pseudomonadota bacterium]